MEEIAIGDCTLRVLVEGDESKPPLVLSHMLGTDLSLWDGLVPGLAEHFRIVRYDTRGHGGSGLGDAPVTLDVLGRDVVAILDALDIERAHFCGVSMGGGVGLWLLAHAPGRIERAVIAGSAAKLGSPDTWNARIGAALADGLEQTVAPTIERWLTPGFVETAPEAVETVRSAIRATSPEGYAACCAALRDMDLREAVRGVAHPVLVLRGSDDPSVSSEDAGQLTEAMAAATSQEIEGRHGCCVEQPAAFAAAVVKFLTAKSLTAKAAPRRASSRRTSGKAPIEVGKAPPEAGKPAPRRIGARGRASRRPVPLTAPVSGKALAKASANKASATRKSAARTAPRTPEPSRRRVAAGPGPNKPVAGTTTASKGAARKTAARKTAATKTAATKTAAGKAMPSSKAAGPKMGQTAKPPKAVAARAPVKGALSKPAPVKAVSAKAVSAKAVSAKRKERPASAAAPRAALGKTRGRAKPAAGAAGKAKPASKAKPAGKASAPVKAAKAPPAKTAKGVIPNKATSKKAPPDRAASKGQTAKTPTPKAMSAAKPAARRSPAVGKPPRSPGRGPAGPGRRKP